MSDKKKRGDAPSYAEASAELDTILDDIESGQIDLDLLAEKVERAAALLALLRQKLAATETKVTKITSELGEAGDDDGKAAAADGDAEADER
jgi:exodeoxyribonuclease VII small subunit